MTRYVTWAIALAAALTFAGPAHAGRGFAHGDGFHHGFDRDHDGDRDFRRHFFFRPFFAFNTFVPFYPGPALAYPPPVYPMYFVGPVAGQPNCQAFQTTVVVGGQAQPAYGRACQGPDGMWRITP